MLAEQLRGLLPPEDLGAAMLTDIVTRVRPLVEAAVPLRAGPARTLDVDIDLGDRRLTGTVGDVFGNNLVAVQLLQPRRQAPAGRVARRARPRRRAPRRELDRAHHRPLGPVGSPGAALPDARRRRPHASPRPGRGDGARASASRCRCRSRRASRSRRSSRSERRGTRDPDAKAQAEWVTPRFNETGFPKEDGDQWHVRAWGEQAPYDLLAAPLLARRGGRGAPPARPLRPAGLVSRSWRPRAGAGDLT